METTVGQEQQAQDHQPLALQVEDDGLVVFSVIRQEGSALTVEARIGVAPGLLEAAAGDIAGGPAAGGQAGWLFREVQLGAQGLPFAVGGGGVGAGAGAILLYTPALAEGSRVGHQLQAGRTGCGLQLGEGRLGGPFFGLDVQVEGAQQHAHRAGVIAVPVAEGDLLDAGATTK